MMGHKIIKCIIPAPHPGGRSRQISEFKASLVYRGNSNTVMATQRNPVEGQPWLPSEWEGGQPGLRW